MKNKKPRIGKNVRIQKNVQIGEDVFIGSGTVIERNAILYDGVRIGEHSYIGPGCILGERLRDYYAKPSQYRPRLCVIGKKSILRAGTIVYSDVRAGDFFETGPYVTIREKTLIGHHTRFGNYSDIQGYCKIGNYVSAHSNVTVGQYSNIEDFVWLHPYAILINDLYPPTSLDPKGPHIGKYCVIGAAAILFPGVHLREHTVVAAQSSVQAGTSPYQLVSGNPGKETVDCRKLVAKIKGEILRPYPWMNHRKKGYPWEKKGR